MNEDVERNGKLMEQNEVQLSELLKVRREKLTELQESGRNPFEITKFERTNTSQQIKDNYVELEGKEVSVAGRIMSKLTLARIRRKHFASGC